MVGKNKPAWNLISMMLSFHYTEYVVLYLFNVLQLNDGSYLSLSLSLSLSFVLESYRLELVYFNHYCIN